MDDRKYLMRSFKKRGTQCLLEKKNQLTGEVWTGLCGCGHRNEPSIEKKRRIVRRMLQRLDNASESFQD